MKKVFSDNLPKWKDGKNKGQINWKESVSYKVKFIYEDIEGEIEIIKYHRDNKNISYVDIKYNNNIISKTITGFLECQIGELLNRHTKKYKYKIGEIIEVVKHGKLEILDQIRIPKGNHNTKGYIYKCLVCGNIDEIKEYRLTGNHGCKVCSGYKVLKGYNDLWTIHPKIAKLLKYPEHGYELSYGCDKFEIFVCPECGYEKSLRVFSVVRQGFPCPRCGDGVSYPNKFVRSFLSQLNEKYIPEYSPDWAFIEHDNPKLNGKKKYDNYLPDRNEIWEVHGLQHFKDKFRTYGKNAKTLKEQQKNDKLKKELVDKNGLKYVVIDASCSVPEYIKNSLLNLPEIKRYDLSKIDWNKCHEFACSSLVKIACNYWNSGIKNTKEIGKLMTLDFTTIITYLKQGKKLGWCDYDSKVHKIIPKNRIKVICLTTNEIFDSITKGMLHFNLKSNTSIIEHLKGNNKSAGKHPETGEPLRWMYYEEFLENKNNLKPYVNNSGKHNIRKVIQLSLEKEFINEWNSITEISKIFNVSVSAISGCCKGKMKTVKNYKWMYKEDYNEYIKQQKIQK